MGRTSIMQSVTLVLCTLASMLLVDAQVPPPMPGSASPPASKPAMDPLMLMMMMQMGQGSGDNSMMPLMMDDDDGRTRWRHARWYDASHDDDDDEQGEVQG